MPLRSRAPSFLELGSDATAVVGTAYADAASGLNIPVANGVSIRFLFIIHWVPNANTTGGVFALNGPTATRLAYLSKYNTTASAITEVLGVGYDPVFTVGTASNTGNNIATVQGVLTPGASGTLALRAAAEVASPGSVTVKAGSSVMWW